MMIFFILLCLLVFCIAQFTCFCMSDGRFIGFFWVIILEHAV